ncbi:uncharacterized protein LOC129960773 [Argiope bruennichi]|uniref:Secreted protein n=1 Tax=Argiope bruennichi TaxID=94029 RepID=A0A8T0FJU5_ARGBR|nr:uncharacterized protein LOC129960773 [Argiope bruennichi]KAF8791271.1 hypothetical protein HNY73_006163 [Argiope bruennichi]
MLLASLVLSASLFFESVTGSGTAESYLDTVLNTALQLEIRSLGFDPLPLPDFQAEFEDHVKIFGKVHGTVKYTEGLLHGLSHARRYGNCSGPYYGYGQQPFVNCSIKLDELGITFNGKLKYGKLPSTSIRAKANMSSTILSIGLSYYPFDLIHLRSFSFLRIGQIQIKFTGLGSILNKYLNVLETGFIEHAWPAIFNSVGKEFQFALANAFERIPYMWYQR